MSRQRGEGEEGGRGTLVFSKVWIHCPTNLVLVYNSSDRAASHFPLIFFTSSGSRLNKRETQKEARRWGSKHVGRWRDWHLQKLVATPPESCDNLENEWRSRKQIDIRNLWQRSWCSRAIDVYLDFTTISTCRSHVHSDLLLLHSKYYKRGYASTVFSKSARNIFSCHLFLLISLMLQLDTRAT